MKKTLLLGVACLIMSITNAQVDCNIANMQGGFAGGFLNWVPGDEAVTAFIDPADDYATGESCGATYPYTIENVGFSLASATAFGPEAGDGLGSFTYQINIYDISGGDPCNAPGTLLTSSGPINVEMDGTPLTPQMIPFDLEVNDAFFVSFEPLTWTGDAAQTPTILWDAVTIPECQQYYTFDSGETWIDWSLILTNGDGWADFNVFGSSESGTGNACEAGTIDDTTPLTLCPDEAGTFSATGSETPIGGGYGLYFVPSADGTGALGDTFNLTNITLPYTTLDSDLGGLLSSQEPPFPPLEGTWYIYGIVYEDALDAANTVCTITEDFMTVTFLTADDEACESGAENTICAEATPVSEGTHFYEAIEGEGATDNCHNDIFAPVGARWFVYTPEADGTVIIRACGDVDTRLSVHTGDCTDLTCHGANDDSDDLDCHPNGWASAIEGLPVSAGVDYYIEWDDMWTDEGSEWEIIWMPLPDCDAPVASAEVDFSDCPSSTFGISVDLSSIGDASSVDIVENVNDGGETVVYDDITVIDLYEMGPYNFGDEVSVVVIHNDDPACNVNLGTFAPGGCPPANDLCEDAIAISCDETVSGTTENASVFSEICVGNDTAPGVWYTFTGSNSENPDAVPGSPGDVVTLSTCNQADYDTKIDVLSGSCGELVCVGGNDDGDDCAGFSSHLILATEVGETYYVYVSGYWEDSFGTFDLTMTCVPAPDCNAGTIVDTTPQTLCPGDTAVFDIIAGSDTISEGYEYALFFVPTTGTGALGGEFYFTGVELPYTYDNSLGGVLPGAGYPNFLGEWQIYGTVVALEGDPWNTYCGVTDDFILVDFLSPADEQCAPAPGEPCTTWVNPTTAQGWTDFNSTFGGAPCNDGDGCPFNEIQAFEVYQSEAYAMDNIQIGGNYTFSHCNGPGAGSWIPEYTIIAPSGAIDAFGPGDGDGCSISWTASEEGTYLIVINEAGACGVAGSTDNGYPAITCNDTPACPPPTEWCDETVNGPWNDFNINGLTGAPSPDEDGFCETIVIDAFEVFQSESYLMENIIEGVEYTFSHCEGPGAGSWIPEYTIYAPSGTVDAYGAGDNGCSISWVATESGTYEIAINEAGACGVEGSVGNGFPSITCAGNVSVKETTSLDFSIFPNPNNGQFVIDYSGASGMAQIDVLTISGKSVVSEQRMMNSNTQLDIDLGNGVSGMYFVRITMDEKSTVLKIIVN